jgi:hypothetical protein
VSESRNRRRLAAKATREKEGGLRVGNDGVFVMVGLQEGERFMTARLPVEKAKDLVSAILAEVGKLSGLADAPRVE